MHRQHPVMLGSALCSSKPLNRPGVHQTTTDTATGGVVSYWAHRHSKQQQEQPEEAKAPTVRIQPAAAAAGVGWRSSRAIQERKLGNVPALRLHDDTQLHIDPPAPACTASGAQRPTASDRWPEWTASDHRPQWCLLPFGLRVTRPCCARPHFTVLCSEMPQLRQRLSPEHATGSEMLPAAVRRVVSWFLREGNASQTQQVAATNLIVAGCLEVPWATVWTTHFRLAN